MTHKCLGLAVSIIATISALNIASAQSVTIVTDPAGLTVTVDGTNYVSPAVFEWAAGSSHTIDVPSPQVSAEGGSRAVFAAWSNGQPQSHGILAPASDTTNKASFQVQYRLDTNVSPAGSGTITNQPPEPWHDAGQLVTLTALTNAGFRLNFWEGVDRVDGATAELRMDIHRSATAIFIPSDFPYIVVTDNGGAAAGEWIGNIDGRTADGTRTAHVILDNTGTNLLFFSTTNSLSRFVTPQGFNAFASGGAFNLKDETLSVVHTVSTLDYTLDTHDVKLLPNGHALLLATEVRTMDLSTLVQGGRTAASVTGNIIQEIDTDGRVVFQWHTFDHIPIIDSFYNLTQANIDYAHINAVALDPTDNHLLACLRTTSEIIKINRQTGEVMWRLGGKKNQFTFVGEHEENAPYYFVGQHDVHRLANGNLLMFDNGNISGGGVTPSDRTWSRVVEYQLDETNKIATLVWEFRHSPDISAPCTGSVKRLANGNTLIGWGCAVPTSGVIATEVSPDGKVVFEIRHRTPPGRSAVLLGNGLTKQSWNSQDSVRTAWFSNVTPGQNCDASTAGASIALGTLNAGFENTLTVQRHLDAVRFPRFGGKAPQVLMERLVLTGSNIVSLEAQLELDLPDTTYVFGTPRIHDPAQVVVYHRATPGEGQFEALETAYDAGTRRVRVGSSQLGEFIFAYPDLAETAYLPNILAPADGSEVNEAATLDLNWVPRGLFRSFDLQVATNSAFTSLLVDTNNLGRTGYRLPELLPGTRYFWRVRAVTEAGASDWASASFSTVPPVLRLVYPAGGEVWQRFQVVTIRWEDNLAENIALDIYKDGVSNRTFAASIPSSGSYTWTVGQFQAFPPGSDYTLRIRSTLNPAIYDFSPPFSLITNITNLQIDSTSIRNLPGGRLQFGFSIPGALEAAVLMSTNLLDWEFLQSVPLTDGLGVFTSEAAADAPRQFYRLRVP